MARRKSYQKGNVQWHNNQWTLRYYLLDHDTGVYKLKRESEALRHCTDRDNKKAALRAAESFMAEINELNNNPKKRLERQTFKAFIEGRWAAYTVNERTQPSTLAVYNSMIRTHFLPFFGNMLMQEITPATVTQFFREFRIKSPNSSYAENLYRLLSSIFSVATQYDDIPNNPVRSKLHKPKMEDREKPTLPLQVHAALINTVDPDYRVLFMLMSVAGLRIGVASLGYDLTKDSIGVQNALGHADEIITKNIYIHISQEQASSVIEAVANRILGENSDLLAQESQSVN